MKRLCAFILLIIMMLALPQAASAALKPDDDPTITEGLRDKGVDWLKDQAKQAGKDWIFETGQSESAADQCFECRLR